ncbi:TIGR03086 family metal-binding protein [Arthrobacter sp. ATA002]|uniref:TIGR03086 family metal-binding protein n=1 Tax=Arthrobacter sp. ATA002 TaxID=2991715 RepID=UPI0022A686F0|nr:TIGR03086 family metal-binding protein [Arthrobacter sp. ATA002]WAP52220.1 TIGR03086 family metal-binding protein [Arthrobacter sp. ATA002]
MRAPVDFHRAARDTGAVIAAVRDEQLDWPTPSPEYTVGDLLDHMDGFSLEFQLSALKNAPPPGAEEAPPADAENLAPGWRERIPNQLTALAGAWADPAAWDGETVAGRVPLAAPEAGLFALDEIVVHGWDLARSTGQQYRPDQRAVQACAEFLLEQPRNPEIFGPAVPVDDAASPLDRLIGLSGRDPGWIPAV